MRTLLVAIGVLLATVIVPAQSAPPVRPASTPVAGLAFLVGDWVANEDTELGRTEAVATFTPDVDGSVIVRRNRVKYSSGKAAGTEHGDLMVIYGSGGADGQRAIYFDNEGHVIHYLVTFSSATTAVFTSDPAGPGPRFRLTHVVSGDRLSTTFEIAPPGQPFKVYVSGDATRRR